METIEAQKKAIRKEKLAERDALLEPNRVMWSSVIARAVRQFVEQYANPHVHCYISYRSEVTTLALLDQLCTPERLVSVPTIQRVAGVEEIVQVGYQVGAGMEPGPFGIPEPILKSPSDTSTVSAVILPLAAFDRLGGRIGYGKGFYDRFLSQLSPAIWRIGLAFSVQETGSVPREEHDQLIDIVVTEHEVIDCATNRLDALRKQNS